jgi:hypothetical protein
MTVSGIARFAAHPLRRVKVASRHKRERERGNDRGFI